jgi:hypothetical protein
MWARVRSRHASSTLACNSVEILVIISALKNNEMNTTVLEELLPALSGGCEAIMPWNFAGFRLLNGE